MGFKTSPTKPSPSLPTNAHSFDLEKQTLTSSSPSPSSKSKKPPTDYKSLARTRLFWIIGLVTVILALLAVISYLEIAKPVMEYHERHG